MKSERKIQNEILLGLNKEFSDRLRLWRNNVGKGYGAWIVAKARKQLAAGQAKEALQTLKSSRPISYGVPGSPDLQGFIRLNGLAAYLGIEVKAKDGQQREKQKKFEKMIVANGGFYYVARSKREAIEYVNQIIARHEEKE